MTTQPITVAASPKTWTVFACSNAGIVGSDVWGVCVCVCLCVCVRLFFVCTVQFVGSGLATGWSLVQGVYRLCKEDYETEEEARAQQRAVEPVTNEWINEWMNEWLFISFLSTLIIWWHNNDADGVHSHLLQTKCCCYYFENVLRRLKIMSEVLICDLLAMSL
jgi:hypothetical protein